MPIQTNLTQARAITEAARVAKLEADLEVYGGAMTTLTNAPDETARTAIQSASSTMATNITTATEAELKTYMDSMA